MICENITTKNNTLYFAGVSTTELAEKYKTPLYIMDENRIRKNCRVYTEAMKKYFDGNAAVLYASKSASFKYIYKIAAEENMGADVVSAGEIYTALKAGFPLENAYFHSNNKTDSDVDFAIKNGIGCFVVDNAEELEVIDTYAKKYGKKQKILLRLTPGIDTHTYEAVNTGKVDSKFGTAIETGQAFEITKYALGFENIELAGFHCHIGSQVFDSDTFFRGSEIMLNFISEVQKKLGFETSELNLGGGYGVRYTENDPVIDIDANIKQVSEVVKKKCSELGIRVPKILMEPGRSISADAGMTLYTVGTVKKITGYKNYVSVDGGMTDNPRYALYGSEYTLFVADLAEEAPDFECSVVGRCCESGDIIQENVMLPQPKRGNIIAVCTTGAYNYSMASNYNRVPRPPIVMIKDGVDFTVVKRESLDDIIMNDL